MEAVGDDNPEVTTSMQDIETSVPDSNSAKENQEEESTKAVQEHNDSVTASNIEDAEDNNEDQMDVTEPPSESEVTTHIETQDAAGEVSTDVHTPEDNTTMDDNVSTSVNVDSERNYQSLAESSIEPNKEGSPENIESNKEGSPENVDSNKEGSTERIESNKEENTDNVESNKEQTPENVESDKEGNTENLESNKEGSPEDMESTKEGDTENLESNKEGSPEDMESTKEGDTENLETNKGGSPENLESNKEGGPENVESNKEGNTENIESNKEGNIENDSASQDFTTDENPVFVHVNTEKDDNDKSVSISEQDEPDVDPIGSSDWVQNNENETRTEEDLDECIIPDTNRILTQEEKDAATNIRDPTDLDQPSSNSEIELPPESENPEWKGKYIVNICTTEVCKKCMMCSKEMTTKYTCTLNRKQTFICSEGCLKQLKEQNIGNVIIRDLRVKNFTPQEVDNLMPSGGIDSRHCMDCGMIIRIKENLLSWETLDFCSEGCLTKYQKRIGSYCSNCNFEVSDNFLGKYCVRFGYNIRQFCSSNCLEEYKKGLKVCSYCQEDMSGNTCGFLASIGDKGLFKDFCSAQCMEKYNAISKHRKGNKPSSECCVCHKVKPMEIEFEFKNKMNTFCSDPCFVAFKFVNNVTPDKCDMCSKFVLKSVLAQNSMFYDGNLRSFCTKTCQNIYITTHRKIVSCCWCKVKKYNFDMIQKCSTSGQVLMMCSLNCLSLFLVSISVAKTKKRCDSCNKHCRGQYHMTLSDSTKKHFCSYPCVQAYQNKYSIPSVQVTQIDSGQINTPPVTKRITRKSVLKTAPRKQIIPDVPGPLPIITSVRSLAPTRNPVTNGGTPTRSLRSKNVVRTTSPTVIEQPSAPPVRKIILVRPPDLPSQRNIATLVKPITLEAGVGFKPICFDKAVQTENLKDSLVIVPVPVPIYVPSPAHMYSLPFPIPIPFPLPIPVPIFIPTTKNTSNGILKEIKKIQVRTPTDPYEADLLMMAELVAVAGDKKEEREESESDVPDEDAGDEGTFSPEPQDASNTFGEDMLQMALKMATDFDEPAVDLEGALTASTITASQGNETHPSAEEQIDDPPPVQPTERPPFRGRKRGRPARHGGRGRGRGRPPNNPIEVPLLAPPEPAPPPEPVEKPDANMCLKYTFGVNAWKQWVTTKNADLEKSSRRVKLFKTEILQLTSDELNYSLCLFVKEVRKPNGAEYAPDTIYYLCLGIQQYLFENGRIDNIFCDSYYEKFTDCLDEVCRKFSSLYNDSQYIVTRVEEEHLWESKQLGAHSPHVLLSTLMFFNTKHFNLTNVEEHMQLSFSHIMKHWKRVPNQPGGQKTASSRNILLRFYPPQSAIEGNLRKKKVYEQQENEENPLRCPVKLYEFYLSKCPESVKTRNDVFYLLPERSCVPDSPVWYSTMALGKEALEKMLHRVKMVKEINVALLAS